MTGPADPSSARPNHAAESVGPLIDPADPVAILLADPDVTDVLINNPDEIWVERANRLERVQAGFPDEQSVRRFAQRLAVQAGRRLDDASPFVDARLPDGSRLHAVLAPLAVGGTCVSLRVPGRRRFTLDSLRTLGTLNSDGHRALSAIVSRRLPFMITGGAGTGKTTLLSAMLSGVDPGERLILVEDCSELTPDHPHVVRLESRPPNQERKGEITLRDLIRQALRMRPSRVVLGEARGPEVIDLLNALNTGHEGGCATVHANRAQDLPQRIESLAMLAGVGREAVHSQMAAALRIAVHLERDELGHRYLQAIAVLRRRNSIGPVQAALALTFDTKGATREWTGYAQLAQDLGWITSNEPADPEGRTFEQEVARAFPAADRSLLFPGAKR
ncbi:MAG TPA: TadA family conjugal transfer-associated ATPase [Actinocrinis sp.]|nr:TadA family conjugal transfer-associated ATPase [Actinocrinis sp.]